MTDRVHVNGHDKAEEGAHLVAIEEEDFAPALVTPVYRSEGLELRKIELEERRLALEEKKIESSALKDLVERLHAKGRIDDDIRDAYEVVAVERLTGLSLGELKPKAPEGEWFSPTDMAAELGSTGAMVGRVLTALELRGTEHERKIVNKASNSDRAVSSSLWSREAFDLVRAELIRRGKIEGPDIDADDD